MKYNFDDVKSINDLKAKEEEIEQRRKEIVLGNANKEEMTQEYRRLKNEEFKIEQEFNKLEVSSKTMNKQEKIMQRNMLNHEKRKTIKILKN